MCITMLTLSLHLSTDAYNYTLYSRYLQKTWTKCYKLRYDSIVKIQWNTTFVRKSRPSYPQLAAKPDRGEA
ncbi:hypothetical protein J27TS7_52200 [Paenibacillus dendritiformis]|nr:hypothetical protein J27TS7_52200 [Paenibacillus dendritiformis]